MIAPFSARKNPAWAQRLTLTTELTPTDSGKTVGWRQGEDESCAKQTTCEGAVLDDMPPEDQLCLLLCRAEPSPVERKHTLELLAYPLSWHAVLERAKIHGITPLLYRNLHTLDFRGVPEPVRAKLADAFGTNSIRNALLAQELVRVLSLLDEAGVPVMPLKGVALAESLYGDPALRVCADIDILVPTRYATHAFRLILSSGYEAPFTHPSLVDLLARYGKDCGLVRQDRTCVYPLQLHCGTIWGGPLEQGLLEEIWSEASRKPFRGVAAFALSEDWEFLYLAVHAARHGLFPLKWLVDLDRLCSRGKVDWEKVKEKARRLGWEKAVQSSLSACASLLDTRVQPLFCGTNSRLPARLHTAGPSALQIPREALFVARLLRSRSRRFRFLAIRLLVPTAADCQFLPLPSSLFFLYYPLRPFRLACAVGSWLVQAGWSVLRKKAKVRGVKDEGWKADEG